MNSFRQRFFVFFSLFCLLEVLEHAQPQAVDGAGWTGDAPGVQKCLFQGSSCPVWALELLGKVKSDLQGGQAGSSPGLEKAGKHRVNPSCAGLHCLVQLLGCCCLAATSEILGRTRSLEGTADLCVHPGKASGCAWEIVTAWHFNVGLESLKLFFSGKDLWRVYCFFFLF